MDEQALAHEFPELQKYLQESVAKYCSGPVIRQLVESHARRLMEDDTKLVVDELFRSDICRSAVTRAVRDILDPKVDMTNGDCMQAVMRELRVGRYAKIPVPADSWWTRTRKSIALFLAPWLE